MTEIGQLKMTFSKELIVPGYLQDLEEKPESVDFDDEADQLFRLSVYSDRYEPNSDQIGIGAFYFERF